MLYSHDQNRKKEYKENNYHTDKNMFFTEFSEANKRKKQNQLNIFFGKSFRVLQGRTKQERHACAIA